MSFRTRLISFFVVIVVLPMIAVGILVFKLIDQSEQGKADARANALALTAGSVYDSASANGRADASAIARRVSMLRGQALAAEVARLAKQSGLARVTVTAGSQRLLDHGAPTAIAPGSATITGATGGPIVITASELTAPQYAHQLAAPGVAVVVRQGATPLGSTLAAQPPATLPHRGTVTIAGADYRSVSQSFRGFGSAPVEVVILSALSATSSSVGGTRELAAGFVAAFLVLAFAFAVLASRALQGQLARFLDAARRIGKGEFDTRVPTHGHDEFAELGREFNQMADELSRRVDELADARARVREAVRRIGQTFASNLDRQALLDLALETAVDAVHAECGRLTTRLDPVEPLRQTSLVGSLEGAEDNVLEAERVALTSTGVGEAETNGLSVASVALGTFEGSDRPHGLITVARHGARFTVDERELLRSLASEATRALSNVELHNRVKRQAITDPLTALTNHGRFQELLVLELEEATRYQYPVGLIMLDIDNFKSFNDTYGHQQGDAVLKSVARVLRDNSREVDVPARYGGEEMALILPHTDLEGSFAIAERVRAAVEALRVPRIGGAGRLHVTASVGVSVYIGGDKDRVLADADGALYRAKRAGKNRTMKAEPEPVDPVAAE